jgi:competence protein ComEC
MNHSGFSPCRQPFFYLTAAFVTGIVSEKFFAPAKWLMLVLLVSTIILSAKFIYNKKSLKATLALLVGFVSVGSLLAQAERSDVKNTRLIRLFEAKVITPDEPVELTGVLIAPPEPAPDAYFLDVEAESLRIFDSHFEATGRARLMLAVSDKESVEAFNNLGLDYGSHLCVLVRLQRARTYQNPGAIDFNDFLERQGYDLKGTIKSPLLIDTSGRAPVSKIFSALWHCRLRMLSLIDERFKQPVAGTLKAMLLGNRYFLDAETSEHLRQSSTFHTLVISGMHVGIIAFALLQAPFLFTLRFYKKADSKFKFSIAVLPRTKERAASQPGKLRIILALIVLWAYALMVGLAPPVTRATVMISVGLVAPLLFRKAASINTVSLAAFVMLALKTALVADPGFQLSFIAVAAIVIIAMPLLNKLKSIGDWRPTSLTPHPPSGSRTLKAFAELLFWDERAFNKEMQRAPVTYQVEKIAAARLLNRLRLQWLPRGIVVLLLTSTAIQLTTLPLMAVYFNRFAPVGILLNVFSGLLTAIIMLLAVLTIAIGLMKISFLAGLVKFFVWLLNAAHFLLANSIAPFANLSGMTFRVAHYEGWQALIYALYFLPIAALAVLVEQWQPLKRIQQRQEVKSQKAAGESLQTNQRPEQKEPQKRHRQSARRFIVCGVLMILLLAVLAVIKPPTHLPKGRLTVYFLDVGQGDAALVVFPQGATMLIDGGGEVSFNKTNSSKQTLLQTLSDDLARPPMKMQTKPFTVEGEKAEAEFEKEATEMEETEFKEQSFSVGEAVVSRFLWSLGLTRIDYVIATHADADHIGGLANIARNFKIHEAIVGRVLINHPEFDAFANASIKQQTPLAMLSAADKIEIEGVTVEVMWPLPSPQIATKSSNNDSIVLRLSYGETAILLTGDIEKEAEDTLVKSGINLRAEVLKIPHHGSKTSSTERFIDAVQPSFAIVSVGERSRFGHPHAMVLERYQKRKVKLLQTGREGMIAVESDGVRLAVKAYR